MLGFSCFFVGALLLRVSDANITGAAVTENGDVTVTVKTQDGYVRGKAVTSFWGKTYYSFQGIPYAQPPLGDLRFKSPRNVTPWDGVRDALAPSVVCPQAALDYTYLNATMSEDCLVLNVYTPQVPSGNSSWPVMVWIHGGAFMSGSGVSTLYGPDNLIQHDVAVVTINYRLGALGFLSLEHPDATFNAGMKDQVAALRWVQRNIAVFGGQPDNVTLFGESAGGRSVDLHMLSPMSAGLFHQAISQSGSALGPRPFTNGTRGAFRLAEVLGYNAMDRDDLLHFLRSESPLRLVQAQTLAQTEEDGSVALSMFPTVDRAGQEGDEVFTPGEPVVLMKRGDIHDIPYITGVNLQEAKSQVQYNSLAWMDTYNTDPEKMVPINLNLTKGSKESVALASTIKRFYFGNESVSQDTIPQLVDVLSDNFMVYGVHRSAKFRLASNKTAPVYMYLFTYTGALSQPEGDSIVKGPGHGDDVPYVFRMFGYKPSESDVKVIDHFAIMWTTMAKVGKPTTSGAVEWPSARHEELLYLQIDLNLTMHSDMFQKRMAFWDQVYESFHA